MVFNKKKEEEKANRNSLTLRPRRRQKSKNNHAYVIRSASSMPVWTYYYCGTLWKKKKKKRGGGGGKKNPSYFSSCFCPRLRLYPPIILPLFLACAAVAINLFRPGFLLPPSLSVHIWWYRVCVLKKKRWESTTSSSWLFCPFRPYPGTKGVPVWFVFGQHPVLVGGGKSLELPEGGLEKGGGRGKGMESAEPFSLSFSLLAQSATLKKGQ